MTSVTPAPDSGRDGGADSRPGSARLAVTPSRRGWRIAAYVAAALVLATAVGWVGTHPGELPTSDTTVTASTPVTAPVHLGVFTAPADFDRTLHVSGVRVFATSTVPVTIVPHVCHGGSVNVTTTPESFCADLGSTEDATLEGGDTIVLEVVADAPGTVEIDRVRVAYRSGLQWATQDAGARSRVVVLAR